MSFTENDRKFRSEKGKSFHDKSAHDGAPFAFAIAAALKVDFGAAPASVKRIARLAGANERTARNWLEGRNGPSGESLVCLMQHSDAVFETVLTLSRRYHVTGAMHLRALREHLLFVAAAIDEIERSPT